MGRTIVVHIGPHKTGSKAIQAFCDRNRAALASSGVRYPTGRWHGQLGSCFAQKRLGFVFNVHGGRTDPQQIEAEDRVYLEEISREIDLASEPTVVLSYEGFFSLGLREIRRLHRWMRARSERQGMVFYCRAPLPFAVSEVSQRLRMGVPNGFDGRGALPVLAYGDVVPPFVRVFGRRNVVAREFDPSRLKNGDVVDDFFEAIGHPEIHRGIAPDGPAGIKNASLSAEAAQLAAELARISPFPVTGNQFFARYGRILSRIRGAAMSLDGEQRERIVAASRPHSEYLAREFGIVFAATPAAEGGRSEPLRRDFVESVAGQLCEIVAALERARAEALPERESAS